MIDVVDKPRQATLHPKLKALLDDETHSQKGYVYCTELRHVISHIDHRIEVGGSHDHHFTNPHGFHFHLGCYREAWAAPSAVRPMPLTPGSRTTSGGSLNVRGVRHPPRLVVRPRGWSLVLRIDHRSHPNRN
jgi:hypothetical protein